MAPAVTCSDVLGIAGADHDALVRPTGLGIWPWPARRGRQEAAGELSRSFVFVRPRLGSSGTRPGPSGRLTGTAPAPWVRAGASVGARSPPRPAVRPRPGQDRKSAGCSESPEPAPGLARRSGARITALPRARSSSLPGLLAASPPAIHRILLVRFCQSPGDRCEAGAGTSGMSSGTVPSQVVRSS